MDQSISNPDTIHQLEQRLLDPVVRLSPPELDRLLADGFQVSVRKVHLRVSGCVWHP
jgi:hypothetical protein